MEKKQKNILIISLLAVVLVMTVGYAAFAQQLNIDGSAAISSRWDVHFQETGASYQTGSTMGTTPTGNITVEKGGLTAEFTAEVVSPGDTVTFTVPIVNAGNIEAVLNSMTLSGTDVDVQSDGITAISKDGNIKYTVTSPGTNVLPAENGTANLIIKAEFVDKEEGNENAFEKTATLKVTLNYVQAQ